MKNHSILKGAYEGLLYRGIGKTSTPSIAVVLVLLLLNLIMLIMGMVLEPTSNLIILTPIFTEIAAQFGIDPIHLGVIMVLNLTIGLITPPVGTCLFTACGIAKISLERLILHGLMPLLLTVIGILFLVTYVPWFSQFLPSLFTG